MTAGTKTQRCGIFRITPMSPIHIGSGQRLTPMDYEIRKDKFIVKDVMGFIDAQRDDPAYALQVIQDRKPIGDEFARYALPCYDDPSKTERNDVGEVLEFLKDPMGKAFLPGSSLKGCIRTAIAWKLVMQLEPRGFADLFQRTLQNKNKNWSFNTFNAALFGANPQTDILKTLVVRDSQPLDMNGYGAMNYVRVMNVMRSGFAPKQGVPIRVESIMPDTGSITVPFIIQAALLKADRDLQQVSKGKPAAMLLQPGKLEETLLDFSRQLLDYESGFYKDYCPNEPAYRFIQQLQKDSNTIYLDLGFGTGWHSKTIGMTFEQNELWKIREQYRMNDRGPDEYPKTRKWARTPKGYLPLGWIKLEIKWED